MKNNRRFLVFVVLCLVGLWLIYSHLVSEARRETQFALTHQLSSFQIPQDLELRQMLIQELHRRISYHLYANQKSRLRDWMHSRYSPQHFEVFWDGSGSGDRLEWRETEEGLAFQGTLATSQYRAEVVMLLTNQWVIDTLGSAISKIPSKTTNAWTFLLEEGEKRIPERHLIHLKDHAQMIAHGRITSLDQFSYSFVRMETRYGSFHLVAVVSRDIFLSRLWKRFFQIGCLFLVFVFLIWFFPRLKTTEFSILQRVLLFQFICFLLLWWLLFEEAERSRKESSQRRRYAREKQVIQGGFSKVKIPSFEEVRAFLPFEEEMIYSLPGDETIFLFQARSGRLEGASYLDLEKESSQGEVFFLLLYVFSVLSSLWAFQDSRIFFKALAQRTRGFSDHGDENLLTLRSSLSYRALYEAFENMIRAIITHDLHQKSASKWIRSLLFERFSIKLDHQQKDVSGTLLWIGPGNPFPFAQSNPEFFFESYSSFLKIVRDSASRFGGVPLFDQSWEQGVYFDFKEPSLGRQRAVITGLAILKAWKLHFPQEPMIGIINTGEISIQVAEAENREEVIAWGSLHDQARAGFEDCRHGSIYPKSFPLLLSRREKEPLKSLFDLEETEMAGYFRVLGVAGMENHLPLLTCESSELQNTALQLCGLSSDPIVLRSVLDVYLHLPEEVLPAAKDLLMDAFKREEGRELIFKRMEEWADEHHQGIDLILQILQEADIPLSPREAKIITSFETPENTDLIAWLVLKSSQGSAFPEFEKRMETFGPNLKALYLFSQALHSPQNDFPRYLAELWELCTSKEETIRHASFPYFRELMEKVKREDFRLSCLRNWYEEHQRSIDSVFKEILREKDPQLTTYILGALVILQTRGMIQELIQVHQTITSIPLKSEIAQTLRRLGADHFLMENLI